VNGESFLAVAVRRGATFGKLLDRLETERGGETDLV
jgi:hypothetical protein